MACDLKKLKGKAQAEITPILDGECHMECHLGVTLGVVGIQAQGCYKLL